VVWCGVVWCGVVRYGVVWCGVVWYGIEYEGKASTGYVGHKIFGTQRLKKRTGFETPILPTISFSYCLYSNDTGSPMMQPDGLALLPIH